MNYAEPIARRRRVAVYLVDSSGDPVLGAVPAAGELVISQSGGTLANGAGTWVETGAGAYYYQATQLEATTRSFMMLIVVVPGARPFVFPVPIGEGIAAGEPVAAARRVPVYLVDSSGDPVTGVAPAGAERQASKNGEAFADCVADLVEIGLGTFYWEAAIAELSQPGYMLLKVAKAPALTYVYRFTVLPGVVVVPDPLPAPYSFGDPEYLDHLEDSLARLPEQFQSPD